MPRDHGGHEIHLVAGPDHVLAGLVAAVILDLFEPHEFVGFAPRADRPMADRAVRAALQVYGDLFHPCPVPLDVDQGGYPVRLSSLVYMSTISQLRKLGLFDARVPRYTSYPTANHFKPTRRAQRIRGLARRRPGGAERIALCACALLPQAVLVLRLPDARHEHGCAAARLSRHAEDRDRPCRRRAARGRHARTAALGRGHAHADGCRHDRASSGRRSPAACPSRRTTSSRSRSTRTRSTRTGSTRWRGRD